jgi:hypothetical protein
MRPGRCASRRAATVLDSLPAMQTDRESAAPATVPARGTILNAYGHTRAVTRRRMRGLPSLATALSLLATLCAWGCGSPTVPAPASAERLSQERDIAEAVLRDFMSRLPEDPSSPPVSFQTICISVDHQDPADSFLLRFSGHAPPVKKGSACVMPTAGYPTGRVIDSSTGAAAVKLDVYSVTWDTGRHVTVHAGYACAGLCGGIYLYDLVLDHDSWKVDHRDVITIA